jgi:RNA polymerase sigma-70 factor (ECF subfamily)
MAVARPAENDADLPLVEALMRGETDALGEFVRRHERWVRGVIFAVTGRSELVDDVAQQVWTAVWQQIGTLRDATKWRSWLYQTARRAAIDASKQRRRRSRSETHADDRTLAEVAGPPASPEQELIATERQRRVMQAIRSLPPHYREPFVLRHLEDWSYAQIGELLQLPTDTVETRLVRARRMLKETLQGAV